MGYKGLTGEADHAGFRVEGNAAARRCTWAPERTAEHIATSGGVESTGVGGKRGEPIGDSVGERMKGFALSAGMAADLALVEDQ